MFKAWRGDRNSNGEDIIYFRLLSFFATTHNQRPVDESRFYDSDNASQGRKILVQSLKESLETKDNFLDRLKGIMECPICYEQIRFGCKQCTNGHAVCGRCSQLVGKCPLCRGAYAECLDQALLGAIIVLEPPVNCRYAEAGCEIKCNYFSLKEHEEICSCRLVHCPLKDCHWIGTPGRSLILHCVMSHGPRIIRPSKRFALSPARSEHLVIREGEDSLFHVETETDDTGLYMHVRTDVPSYDSLVAKITLFDSLDSSKEILFTQAVSDGRLDGSSFGKPLHIPRNIIDMYGTDNLLCEIVVVQKKIQTNNDRSHFKNMNVSQKIFCGALLLNFALYAIKSISK